MANVISNQSGKKSKPPKRRRSKKSTNVAEAEWADCTAS